MFYNLFQFFFPTNTIRWINETKDQLIKSLIFRPFYLINPVPTANLNDLPIEILIYIFKDLSQEERVRLGRVCKLWHKIFHFPQVHLISELNKHTYYEVYLEHQPLNIVYIPSGWDYESPFYARFDSTVRKLNKQQKEHEKNMKKIIQDYGKSIYKLGICGEFQASELVQKSLAQFPNLICIDLIGFHIVENFSVFFSYLVEYFGPRLVRFRLGLACYMYVDECIELILKHLNPNKLKALSFTVQNENQLLLVCNKFPLLTELGVYSYHLVLARHVLRFIEYKKLLPNLKSFMLVRLSRFNTGQTVNKSSLINVTFLIQTRVELYYGKNRNLQKMHINDLKVECSYFYDTVLEKFPNLKSLMFLLPSKDKWTKFFKTLACFKNLNSLSIKCCHDYPSCDILPQQTLPKIHYLSYYCEHLNRISHFSIKHNQKSLLSIFPNLRSLIISIKPDKDSLEFLIDHLNQMVYLKKVRLLFLVYCNYALDRLKKLKKKFICLENRIKAHNESSHIRIEIFYVQKNMW